MDVTVGPDVVIRVNNDHLVSGLSEADTTGFSGKMIAMFSLRLLYQIITSFSFYTNFRQNLELKTYLVIL